MKAQRFALFDPRTTGKMWPEPNDDPNIPYVWSMSGYRRNEGEATPAPVPEPSVERPEVSAFDRVADHLGELDLESEAGDVDWANADDDLSEYIRIKILEAPELSATQVNELLTALRSIIVRYCPEDACQNTRAILDSYFSSGIDSSPRPKMSKVAIATLFGLSCCGAYAGYRAVKAQKSLGNIATDTALGLTGVGLFLTERGGV